MLVNVEGLFVLLLDKAFSFMQKKFSKIKLLSWTAYVSICMLCDSNSFKVTKIEHRYSLTRFVSEKKVLKKV